MSDSLEKSPLRFNSKVEQTLKTAGWEPGRVVSENQLKQWMVIEWPTESGYHFQTRMFSAAWHILREFGGLTVEFMLEWNPFQYKKQQFIFDPFEAIRHTQAYNWPLSEWEADGSLYPIGCLLEGSTDDSAIAVDGRGRILMVGDADLLVGSNIDEALHNVINGLPLKDWEVEEWKGNEATEIFPFMREQLGLK